MMHPFCPMLGSIWLVLLWIRTEMLSSCTVPSTMEPFQMDSLSCSVGKPSTSKKLQKKKSMFNV